MPGSTERFHQTNAADDRLPRLERIAEPDWQDGQVVSLAAPPEPVRIADSWTLCAPGASRLGLD